MKLNASVAARILRVNHGGEHGAIHIYRAQIWMARRRAPDLLPFLSEALEHERDHRRRFRMLMPSRVAKPCRLMWIWAGGGALLGLITGLMGRRWILACTEVVERTVHRHLDQQIAWAADHDQEMRRVIAEIQVQEHAHLSFAMEARDGPPPPFERLLASTTEALIWLSTRGDSARLVRDLREGATK